MLSGSRSQETSKEKVQVRLDQERAVAAYLEARHRDVKTLKEALAKGDYGLIRALSRKACAQGAAYGFAGLGRITADLTAAADQRDDPAVKEAIHALHLYLEGLEIEHI